MKTVIYISIIVIIVAFPFLFNYIISLKHKKQNMHGKLDNQAKSPQGQDNKRMYIILAVTLILVFGLFYWFQYRPAQIRIECSKHLTGLQNLAPDESRPRGLLNMGSNSGEEKYQKCLAEKGLK
jgi:preprotein translocase subunit YajC